MVFVSRRIAYPFFTVVILCIFFFILYLAFFSSSLVADVNDSSVTIVDSMIVINIPLENKSTHVIDNIIVTITSSKGSQSFPLKGANIEPKLLPGERYEFLASVPLGESFSYSVTVSSSFNRPIYLSVPIDPSTVDPVSAEVFLPSVMVVGREYMYSVKLCNNSLSDLREVFWLENAAKGDFKQTFYETSIPIDKSECQTKRAYLTPIRTGDIKIVFSLRVGAIRKEVPSSIIVVDAQDDDGVLGDVLIDSNSGGFLGWDSDYDWGLG